MLWLGQGEALLHRQCGVEPAPSGGASNAWDHLYRFHRPVWYEHMQLDGRLAPTGDQALVSIQAGIAARNKKQETSQTKISLSTDAKAGLDALAAKMVVLDDRDFNDCESDGFKTLLRAATQEAYEGTCGKTIAKIVSQLAVAGKQNVSAAHSYILHGEMLRTVFSADYWSKNGVALLVILSHFIVRKRLQPGDREVVWTMHEMLAGAIPCSDDRHTGEHTEEISLEAWEEIGVAKPEDDIFHTKTDEGSNMIKGYEKLRRSPCTCHKIERDVKVFVEGDDTISAVISKGRALVGFFNSSTIGSAELKKRLTQLGIKGGLVQDVLTRWRSTYDMADSLRRSMQGLINFEMTIVWPKSSGPPDTWAKNKLSLEEFQIIVQIALVLYGLAAASTVLEGKNYPTSNLVLYYIFGCIALLHADVSIRQPWDKVRLRCFAVCLLVI